jgi:hypothetical protein
MIRKGKVKILSGKFSLQKLREKPNLSARMASLLSMRGTRLPGASALEPMATFLQRLILSEQELRSPSKGYTRPLKM